MKLPRREFLRLAAGAAVLRATAASAQSYPTRPVHIIVGFAAGGATDIIARLAAQALSERLGGQFVVENRRAPAPISRPTWSCAPRPTATRYC